MDETFVVFCLADLDHFLLFCARSQRKTSRQPSMVASTTNPTLKSLTILPTNHLPPFASPLTKSPIPATPHRWSVPHLSTLSITDTRPSEDYAVIMLNQPVRRINDFNRLWSSAKWKICADGGANRVRDVRRSVMRTRRRDSDLKEVEDDDAK